MKLEQQVCSLESAKRLKELGVRQESIFVWEIVGGNANLIPEHYASPHNILEIKRYSAFTVAELGEMLPHEMSIPHKAHDGFWQYDEAIYSLKGDSYSPCFVENTEAAARAKMLIYLLENKLMEVPK